MLEYTSCGSSGVFSDSDSNLGSEVGSPTSDTQYARVNRVILDKNSDEYKQRRERNNLAVKKSRTKSKLKSMLTTEKVNLLKAENQHLHQKVEMLTKELRLLKDIFVAHASSAHGAEITEHDLRLLTQPQVPEVPYRPTVQLSSHNASSVQRSQPHHTQFNHHSQLVSPHYHNERRFQYEMKDESDDEY